MGIAAARPREEPSASIGKVIGGRVCGFIGEGRVWNAGDSRGVAATSKRAERNGRASWRSRDRRAPMAITLHVMHAESRRTAIRTSAQRPAGCVDGDRMPMPETTKRHRATLAGARHAIYRTKYGSQTNRCSWPSDDSWPCAEYVRRAVPELDGGMIEAMRSPATRFSRIG